MLSLLANAIYKTSELVVTMCFILLTNDLSRWLIKQYKHLTVLTVYLVTIMYTRITTVKINDRIKTKNKNRP